MVAKPVEVPNKKHKDAKIRESLFWEFNMEEMDFELMKPVIVQRVIERGRLNDFYAILNLYGLEEVKNTIKKLNYSTTQTESGQPYSGIKKHQTPNIKH